MLLFASWSLKKADLALVVREFHSSRSSDIWDAADGRGLRLSTRQQNENNLTKKLTRLGILLPTKGMFASSCKTCSVKTPGRCKNECTQRRQASKRAAAEGCFNATDVCKILKAHDSVYMKIRTRCEA
jgi:hypothetical protein